jgi:hypothetical protein
MKSFAVALFIVLTLQVAAQQANRGAIEGVVVNAEGTPLSKTTVDVLMTGTSAPLYTTRSGADGRFFVPNVAPANTE